MKSLALAVVIASAFVPRLAAACATCACGDPTLTVYGAEQPVTGRLRLALEARHRSDAIGSLSLAEQQLVLSLSYAPLPWLFVSASVPAVYREVERPAAGSARGFGVGDVELRAKAFVYRSPGMRSRHLVAATAGVAIPTGRLLADDAGPSLSGDLDLETGVVRPLVGASYAWFDDPLSFYASVTGLAPIGHEGSTLGASALASAAVQVQPVPAFALRIGVDARFDLESTTHAGLPDPDSGGAIVFLAPAVLVSPATDWILQATVRAPAVQALRGEHLEGTIVDLGLIIDF